MFSVERKHGKMLIAPKLFAPSVPSVKPILCRFRLDLLMNLCRRFINAAITIASFSGERAEKGTFATVLQMFLSELYSGI